MKEYCAICHIAFGTHEKGKVPVDSGGFAHGDCAKKKVSSSSSTKPRTIKRIMPHLWRR